MTQTSEALDTTAPRAESAPDVGNGRRMTGVTLGGWQLVRLVGEGALTRVFQARPERSPADWPADYAVKTLKPSFAADPKAAAQLAHEVAVGRRIAHPHLISILAAQTDRRPQYVVMPYMSGATLQDAVASAGRVATPVALWIARQVAEALDAIHRAGYVHGDIKPANIFVSPDGHATLLDLGFARRFDEAEYILDRPFLGTLRYAAPELFTSSLRHGPASDLYSLGIVLHEMLTGEPPFADQSPAELAQAHLRRVPPAPRSIAPQMSRDVARLLRRLLAKDPLRRPQTAEELAHRLALVEVDTFGERLSA